MRLICRKSYFLLLGRFSRERWVITRSKCIHITDFSSGEYFVVNIGREGVTSQSESYVTVNCSLQELGLKRVDTFEQFRRISPLIKKENTCIWTWWYRDNICRFFGWYKSAIVFESFELRFTIFHRVTLFILLFKQ